MTLIDLTERTKYKSDQSIVKVTNTNYKDFKSFYVSRSIDNVCGSFRIEMSRPDKSVSPFKPGDTINILLDDNQVMRGKIDKTIIEGAADLDAITLIGRDITSDLIDSTVPDDSKVYSEGVNIFTIAINVIRSLGLSDTIGVVNLSGTIDPFTSDEIISCGIGERAIKFLLDYCRKRRLFINTSTEGNLVFFKGDSAKLSPNVIENKRKMASFGSGGNNVISYKTIYDISDRYNRYTCKTQKSDGWGDKEVDSESTVFDSGIGSTRQFEFKLEEGADSSEANQRAIEESNVRRARGFEYRVIVQGFGDKKLWKVNELVRVIDDFSGLYGTFLVKAVEYSLDSLKGRLSKLTLVTRDAFTAEAAIRVRDSQRSDIGRGWVNKIAGKVVDKVQEIILGDSNE